MNIILTDKRSKNKEFFINLFEFCNMSCAFCWQDHDSKDGMESVVEKADSIYRSMQDSGAGVFTINLMGGELFNDEISDQLFEDYCALIDRLKYLVKDNAYLISINWVTNLVFTDIERVKRLVDHTRGSFECWLTTSYDPTGRFTANTFKLFKLNLKAFGTAYVRTISVVLTKPNIDKFLKAPDMNLLKMSADFNVYFDTYSPEHNADKLAPSDSDLLAMHKYMIQVFPHTQPANDFITKRKQDLFCRSDVVINPDGSVGQCGSLVPASLVDSFEVPISLTDNNSIEDNFLDKNECLTCEYYKICGLGCFLLHSLKGRRDLDECVYKKIYRFAGERHEND